MKKIEIVVGLGFGDEGKGLVTDYLSAKTKSSLIVRFNGGGQAGHTVVTPDGRRHVFSNFGAGCFNNMPTYWSKYCTFSPPAFMNELQALKNLGLTPVVFLDNLSPVITHYDVLYNRLLEKARGNKCHGSVGAGFGTTISRHAYTPFKFHARELCMPGLVKFRLQVIRDYYWRKANEDKLFEFDEYDHHGEDVKFMETCAILFNGDIDNELELVNEHKLFQKRNWDNIVFEGAQGILLDMDHGFFPHVTHSYTTSRNAMAIIDRNFNRENPVSMNYVSRIYHTRHGAGPLFYEDQDLYLQGIDAETNTCNEYQGNFRVAPLNLDLLKYALDCDANYCKGAAKNVVLTCTNQIPGMIPYVSNNRLYRGTLLNLKGIIKGKCERIYTSNSATRDGMNDYARDGAVANLIEKQ